VIEKFARSQRADAVLKLAALPHERIEAILLKRGVSGDSVAEVKGALTALDIVLDAEDAVAYSFREPYRVGRFGDGRIGVFYSALEVPTCIAEISYRFQQQFNEQRLGAFRHDRYYHLITCNFAGITLNLVGEEASHPELISPTEAGYPLCQRLARAAVQDGIDALYTRSARELTGTCVPVFAQTSLSGPRVLSRFRFFSDDIQTEYEELPRTA
jgi:hypothetical protein